MAVNVAYEGISLAEGALVRPSEMGLFLPLPAPMPVGSRLLLERRGEGQQRVRVTRVREGAEPGVYIVAEGAMVLALVEDAILAPHVPRAVEPEVTTPSPPPTGLAAADEPSAPQVVVADRTVPEVAVVVAAPVAVSPPDADAGDGEGDEDDTILTVTNGSDKPDTNGERGARKGKRGKRGGGKR